MRRSSRLAKKKRVNYNEDALWYRAAKTTKEGWNRMIERVKDDPEPMFRRRQQFRPMQQKKAPQVVRRKLARVEQDAREVNFRRQDLESAQSRVDRVLKQKPVKMEKMVRQPVSRKRKHLLFMNPGNIPIGQAIRAINNGEQLPPWARPFKDQLSLSDGRLQWTEGGDTLPFALKEEKRAL